VTNLALVLALAPYLATVTTSICTVIVAYLNCHSVALSTQPSVAKTLRASESD